MILRLRIYSKLIDSDTEIISRTPNFVLLCISTRPDFKREWNSMNEYFAIYISSRRELNVRNSRQDVVFFFRHSSYHYHHHLDSPSRDIFLDGWKGFRATRRANDTKKREVGEVSWEIARNFWSSQRFRSIFRLSFFFLLEQTWARVESDLIQIFQKSRDIRLLYTRKNNSHCSVLSLNVNETHKSYD